MLRSVVVTAGITGIFLLGRHKGIFEERHRLGCRVKIATGRPGSYDDPLDSLGDVPEEDSHRVLQSLTNISEKELKKTMKDTPVAIPFYDGDSDIFGRDIVKWWHFWK